MSLSLLHKNNLDLFVYPITLFDNKNLSFPEKFSFKLLKTSQKYKITRLLRMEGSTEKSPHPDTILVHRILIVFTFDKVNTKKSDSDLLVNEISQCEKVTTA